STAQQPEAGQQTKVGGDEHAAAGVPSPQQADKTVQTCPDGHGGPASLLKGMKQPWRQTSAPCVV
ncbi:MAG TPA: hypothetical protein VF331_05920, partial [Polyangiales bacterium]